MQTDGRSLFGGRTHTTANIGMKEYREHFKEVSDQRFERSPMEIE